MSIHEHKHIETRATWIRILITLPLLIGSYFLPQHFHITLGLWAVYGLISYDVLYHAIFRIFHGSLFDENLLMSIASIGALIIGDTAEAIWVMFLYQLGEQLQEYATDRSRDSIRSVMDIRPQIAHIIRRDDVTDVPVETILPGDMLLVQPGEKLPIDGIVTEGSSLMDTSPITGESIPMHVAPGESVISGFINMRGVIKIRADKRFADSTVSHILTMVENAVKRKTKTENFITRFARIYTPIVIGLACILAVLPPIFLGEWQVWGYRALVFLVTSCPCALIISIPMGFFAGLGNLARKGILVKGSNYLEALSRLHTVVFDKTGTLTQGIFQVTDVNALSISSEQLLAYAAYAECHSNHPIAQSIRTAYAKPIDQSQVHGIQEYPGLGVSAIWNEQHILTGNLKLMEKVGIPRPKEKSTNHTQVYVVVDGIYMGVITIADTPKPDAAATLKALHQMGIQETIMLTGDRKAAGESIAKELGLQQTYTELLPTQKVTITESLLSHLPPNRTLTFVGDGVNDAPVLARADVGIAMGAIGADAAIEAADVVIMNDELAKLPTAIITAKATTSIIRQNIVFTLGVKILVLALGAFGFVGMGGAVFADVGVCMITMLNALRVKRT